MKLGLGLGLARKSGASAPAIITATVTPALSGTLYDGNDTDDVVALYSADLDQTSNYASTAGTISTVVVAVSINGGAYEDMPVDPAEALAEDDTVRIRVTVTDSEANVATFTTGTLTVQAAVAVYATSVVATPTGGTTAQLDIVAGPTGADVYWFVSTSATPPSAADLKAGTGAVDFGTFEVTAIPTAFDGPSGLTASTGYWVYVIANHLGVDSSIVSDDFTTEAADVTAPTLSAQAATVLSPTAADISASTTEARGKLYVVVGTVNSAPNAAQIKLGQDGSGTTTNVKFSTGTSGVAVSTTGTQTVSATGLTAVAHYAWLYHEDPSGNGSSVVATGAFTPADVTAPVLTSPEAAVSGSYAATVQFNTDEAGTADIVFTTSATTPTAAQIKAGQDHTGAAVAAGEFIQDEAIGAAGHQSITGGDLDGGTAYYAHIAQHDAALNDADPVTSVATFNTAAAAVPAAMSAPALTVVSDTEISVDRAAAPARNGADITSYDLRHSPDESTWTTVTGITDPQSITGLTASTLYYVQTRAVNSAGNGGWSTSATATTDAGGAFDPASLFSSNEGGLYDPSDTSTLWKDTAGTDPVTADGDLVARIDDLSGNGNHLVQATTAAQPRYKTSGGKHWVEQIDTGDSMANSTGVITPSNAFYAAASVQIDTGGGIQRCVLGTQNTFTSSNAMGVFQRSDGTVRSIFAGLRKGTGTANSINLASSFTIGAGVTMEAYCDGSTTLTASNTSTTATAAPTLDGTPVPQSIKLFSTDGTHIIRFYGGIIINRDLTSGEKSDMRTWLAARR